jgi:hypothetical protein
METVTGFTARSYENKPTDPNCINFSTRQADKLMQFAGGGA